MGLDDTHSQAQNLVLARIATGSGSGFLAKGSLVVVGKGGEDVTRCRPAPEPQVEPFQNEKGGRTTRLRTATQPGLKLKFFKKRSGLREGE